MAVTSASFVESFPEFRFAAAAQLTARLAQIELTTGDCWAGEARDLIVMLQLADALAISPSGRDAQLSEPGQATTYRKQLWGLVKAKGFANADLRLGTVFPFALTDFWGCV